MNAYGLASDVNEVVRQGAVLEHLSPRLRDGLLRRQHEALQGAGGVGAFTANCPSVLYVGSSKSIPGLEVL